MTATESPLLQLPGAVASDAVSESDASHSEDAVDHSPAVLVPRHYGHPLREQRDFALGRAVMDVSDLAVLTVSGADRLSWIDSFTSNLVRNLEPGQSSQTLLLDQNGRIEHVLDVVDDGQTLWIMTAASGGAELLNFLQRMRFALRVEVRLAEPGEFSVFAACGEQAADYLAALPDVLATWVDPWQLAGGHQYAEVTEHPGDDFALTRVIVPAATAQLVATDAAQGRIKAAGTEALAALEVRAWRPTADDIDARALPHEFDWLRSAVHLNKGCYRGQETVAKVHNLGHPPRRVVMLHLDGSRGNLPASGDLVFLAGSDESARPVGRVTRAVNHYEDGPIALALLKRNTDVTAELEVRTGEGPILAAQEVIVPVGAGATRQIPKLKRL